MDRIKEKLELINHYDNNLMNSNIKYLTKDIIKSYKKELQEWNTKMGLSKAHSRTMLKTERSREKLQALRL